MAVMPMPEASMNEHGCLAPDKRNIWLSWQVFAVQTVAFVP
jgi:hypothetical protein